MFIPLKMVLIGIDPYPYEKHMKQLVWTLGSLFRLVSACDAKKSACTEVHSGSRLKTFSQTEHEYLEISTLWLFNIAMENGPFIDDLSH